jgi:hypothetical protein
MRALLPGRNPGSPHSLLHKTATPKRCCHSHLQTTVRAHITHANPKGVGNNSEASSSQFPKSALLGQVDCFRVRRHSGAVLQLTESAIASHPLNLVFALKEPLHALNEDLVDVRIGEWSRAHLQTVIHG